MKSPRERYKKRGGEQRNLAIQWLRDQASGILLENQLNSNEAEGVVYFGDDDNTYDIQHFEEVQSHIL